jgi:putative phosphoesterase
MRIGVLGDTHDRLTHVERIVSLFQEASVDAVVHTGDITRPDVLERLGDIGVPMVGVFGNNDRHARNELLDHADRSGMRLVDPPLRLEWADRRILITHDPEDLPSELPSPLDLVLHGHTHRHRHETRGGTLIFNPGECAGWLEGRNAVGIVDLPTLQVERLRF